jgi:hypothetical protein
MANAQLVTNEHQVVLAAEVMTESSICFAPSTGTS